MARASQAILWRMSEFEDGSLRSRTTSIVWSQNVVTFLQEASMGRELDIYDAADALRMTLRVWLAGPAANGSRGRDE